MLDFNFIKNYITTQLKSGNILIQLIVINVVLYLFGVVVNVLGMPFGYNETGNFLADVFSKNWLFVPSGIKDFLFKPYTLLTYQFLHGGFFHLISNMFIVFYFGKTFITLTHKKKLLPLYLLGGIFSASLFLLAYNIIPNLVNQNYSLVGASGSAMAILAAVATLVPDREIYLFSSFKVKYKWIALFFMVINLLSISGPDAAGNYAHLGGLLFGYLFIRLYKSGFDLAKYFNKLFNKILSFFTLKKEPRVTYVNDKFKDKKTFDSYTKPTKLNQEKVDAILDKISQSGYDKLTKAEKDFLFKNSNNS